LVGVVAGALGMPGGATVRVVEHNGHSSPGDYDVTWYPEGPWISINKATDPNDPNDCYWFECYEDGTLTASRILGITPGEALTGNVDLMVRHYDCLRFGASDIWALQFDQAGVTANIKYLEISGQLG
jgi:hypothetical protein